MRNLSANNNFNIIRVSDLKIYHWIQLSHIWFMCDDMVNYARVCHNFSKEFIWWYSHEYFFDHLGLFRASMLHSYKDFIVHINYKVYKVKQDDYIDSEALLLDMLYLLYFYWISLWPVLADAFNFILITETEKYDYFINTFSFLYTAWYDVLPAINELIIILHKIGSNFVFPKGEPVLPLDYWPLYIDFILPLFYLDFGGSTNRSITSLKLWLKTFFLSNKNTQQFLIVTPDIFKFREILPCVKEHRLNRISVQINNLINDVITSDISDDTINFLFCNTLVDIEKLRLQFLNFFYYTLIFLITTGFWSN